MRKWMLIGMALIQLTACYGRAMAENDTVSKKLNKYVLGFVPSKANNIYGIAIGPLGSEIICNKPYTKYSHGLNLQIPGQGFIQSFYIFNSPFKKAYKANLSENALTHADTALKRVIHNGLLVSLTGTFSDQVNGISISGWMSLGNTINGISINPLWNLYFRINGLSISLFNSTIETKGTQIGLINKTLKLKGIQIGIWNKNEKRSLPFINWNFKD
ncbi:MAG: hypothetical protein K8F24_05955 [Bacteroidales bacterium]|nr:hypothetical protein [Bacteroidales bacterium]